MRLSQRQNLRSRANPSGYFDGSFVKSNQHKITHKKAPAQSLSPLWRGKKAKSNISNPLSVMENLYVIFRVCFTWLPQLDVAISRYRLELENRPESPETISSSSLDRCGSKDGIRTSYRKPPKGNFYWCGLVFHICHVHSKAPRDHINQGHRILFRGKVAYPGSFRTNCMFRNGIVV